MRAAAAVGAVAALAACMPRPAEVVPAQPAVAAVTPSPEWEAAFTRTDGWTGADGAASIPLPGGRTLWLFGDTFIGPVVDGRHAQGTTMVNNTVAVQPIAAGAAAPIAFHWGPPDDKAAPTAWCVPQGGGVEKEWFWPAGGGVVADGRLLLFMCRLGRRDAGDSIWNFEPRGTTLLTIDNPQADAASWRPVQHHLAPLKDGKGRLVTWGASVLADGGMLTILGIDTTNVLDKRLVVARVAAREVERFNAWRFWDGEGWSADPATAKPVVGPLASELSVFRLDDGGHRRWVMLYSELTLGSRVLCRVAPALHGPWSKPVTLYECPEPTSDKRLFVYAPKAHPELSRPDKILVSYCVNSTDFWDVVANAGKYRPRFIRVPAGMVPAP